MVPSDIDTPVIVTPIRVDYLSPKRGPTDGGITTEIYGVDFNATCSAFFDGVESAQTTFINSTRLVAEVPSCRGSGGCDGVVCGRR